MNRQQTEFPPEQYVSIKIAAFLCGIVMLGCAAAFIRELSAPFQLYILVPGENYRWHI